ncbi:MAG: RtcB family protein [Tindallia sp. MSAO_Bac2]|nr:MAG: RtcB family protein [Tindallia sp. MSAO_Bac2]
MFTIQPEKLPNSRETLPIKVWLPGIEWLEEGCLQQAKNLSRYPYAVKQIALMADTHQGFGMPIGGVMATRDVVVPNAVGVDIGCGVAFCESSVDMQDISKSLLTDLVSKIMREIPQGFNHHKSRRDVQCIKEFKRKNPEEKRHEQIWKELDAALYQIGTLGGGNHFIEFQQNEKGKLCLMVHSGSRNIGYKIAGYFNRIAGNNKNKWNSDVPKKHELDFIPIECDEGQSYLKWMNLARAFAQESRQMMMHTIFSIFEKQAGIRIENSILDVHHNDVNCEKNENEKLWIHRKGAIRANKDELGIVPGAMGRKSYIVKGKGNQDSFFSCSHGAGRAMSRKQAKKQFDQKYVTGELDEKHIILGKSKLSDVGEEAPGAYKDIDFVLEQQKDLLKPVQVLEGRAVIKG